MPYVNLQITHGASREQEARISAEFTSTLQNILGNKPEHTHIVTQEIGAQGWSYAGLLADDWKERRGREQ